ncbi:MAG: TolC family protein, partial [Bryobacteraceae bacterium]
MLRKSIATLLLCVIAAPAQQYADLGGAFFPKPGYFRETFSTPNHRVELRPPVRLSDFVVGGKLELSLRSFIELVLANNTDVELTRLNVETAKNAVTRAFAPFDPFVVANWTSTRTTSPTNDALAGATTLSTLNQPLNLNYNQLLETGTQYNVTFNGSKQTTNSGFATFNPAINTNLQFGFVQPLLRGRGAYVNRLPVMVARSRLRVSEYQLRENLLRLLSTAELVYWRGVQLRENLRVRDSALDLADRFLKRSQRELELGAISRLDIFQPEFQYAQAQGLATQARYSVLQQDDAIRRQIGADLDPDIRRLPIVLTETPTPPVNTGAIDADAMVERALMLRPDLKVA